MNTADEYIPDGNEYQTGKTYNGKAVFRQCSSGTTAYNTSGNNFSQLGTLKAPNSSCVLLTQCRIARSDGYSQEVTIVGDTQTLVGSDGRYYVWFASSSSTFVGKPYIAWIEYTKS
jgi:hypothetical protein